MRGVRWTVQEVEKVLGRMYQLMWRRRTKNYYNGCQGEEESVWWVRQIAQEVEDVLGRIPRGVEWDVVGTYVREQNKGSTKEEQREI